MIASGFGLPKAQPCYLFVNIGHNSRPLLFLSGATILRMDVDNLSSCPLNRV